MLTSKYSVTIPINSKQNVENISPHEVRHVYKVLGNFQKYELLYFGNYKNNLYGIQRKALPT